VKPSGRPLVALSMGDPSGIGPEVLARALARPRVRRALIPVVFGDASLCPPPAPGRLIAVTRLSLKDRRPGHPTREGGRAQLAYVDAAIAAARQGQVDALCTAPVSKEQISRAGIPFMGHTERLAEAFGVEVLMLMSGPRLRVALATNHLPLADVPRALHRDKLIAQLRLLSTSLTPRLGRRPRLAVCGLNPHAGEGGLLGKEELTVIAPAIRAARARGVDCHGPLAADGLLAKAAREGFGFDAVLAMFHDQGLVAAKALDFERTVNVTLGLPVPRTSPDHGVAYDLAGQGVADDQPMVSALLEAAALAAPPATKPRSGHRTALV
jgi:4-hydroxythreonine-4-phosphate dehydrogenase